MIKKETYIQNLGDYFLKGYLPNMRSFIYLSFLEKKSTYQTVNSNDLLGVQQIGRRN